MKKLFIIAIAAIAVSVSACNSKKSTTTSTDSIASDSVSNATMVFESSVYNFGKITEGDKVSYDFKFKNTGTDPLIITNATASCGCTVPAYPHAPIAPGATAVISVIFDSTGKSGIQNKQVMITSNAKNASTELFLKGEVQSLNK